MRQSMLDEVVDTVADVVIRGAPVDEAFLSNETVRDRNVELLYRRARIAAGEPVSLLDDLAEWPTKGVRAQRKEAVPGQHAGILSTSHMQLLNDSPRANINEIYPLLWCTDVASTNVATEAVLHLGVLNLRLGDGWRALAARPVCTDCHARLDYGMQFFAGFPSAYRAVDFSTRRISSTGRDRFSSTGSPTGSVKRTCRRTVSQRWSSPTSTSATAWCPTSPTTFSTGRLPPEDRAAIDQAFRGGRSIKAAMRAALLRFAQDADAAPMTEPTASADPDTQAAPSEPTEELHLGAEVRAEIDAKCVACHTEAPRDFRGATLARSTVEAMLRSVAFRMMPKTAGGFGEPERRKFVGGLVSALGADETSQRASMDYFGNQLRPAAVHAMDAALQVVAQKAGAAVAPMPLMERIIDARNMVYTPGFAGVVAVEALSACKAAGRQGDALERCSSARRAARRTSSSASRGRPTEVRMRSTDRSDSTWRCSVDVLMSRSHEK